MWQKQTQYKSVACLTLLLAMASSTLTTKFAIAQRLPGSIPSFHDGKLFAQTPSSVQPVFPLPTNVERGTVVRLDGSSSMAGINNELKRQFEQKFAGSQVEVGSNGASAAIKGLQGGKIDIAAIGRGLTTQELQQGLEQYRLKREKIAIIVGEKNPFQGSLTNEQFAKIFRGEITDWSQVGGEPGKIRFIDRPSGSDTREAFRSYPVFKNQEFTTGKNAVQVETDDTAAIIKELGADGISYAIAHEVVQTPGVRVLRMHQILPDDERYPYSQPFVYAYKQNPNIGVKSFLGFASSEIGTQAVKTAQTNAANAIAQSLAGKVANLSPDSPTPTEGTTPNAIATTNAQGSTDANATGNIDNTNNSQEQASSITAANTQTADTPTSTAEAKWPWWWLLAPVLLGLGGGALLWLLTKGSRNQEEKLAMATVSGDASEPTNNPSLETVTDIPNSNTVENQVNTARTTSLWERLAQEDENQQLAAPVDVVMPDYPSHDSTTDIQEVVSSTEVNIVSPENSGNNTEISQNTVTNDANLLGSAALLAGTTAVGTGLWGLLNQQGENSDINPPVTEENLDVSASAQIPETEIPGLDVNVNAPQTPEISGLDTNVDIPQNTEIPGLDVNIDVPQTTEIPGLDVNVDIPQTTEIPGFDVNVDIPQTPEISELDVNVDVPQTTEIPGLDVNVDIPQTTEIPGFDVNVDIPQTPEISELDVNVDVPQTTEIPGLDVDTTQNTETFEATPLPDVWEETPQATETPNIIGNIMSAGSGVAAGVAAAGMGLWGLVNNPSQNDEQTNPEDTQELSTNPNLETTEISGLDVNVDVPQTPEISGLDVNVDIPQTPEISGLDVNVDVPQTPEISGLDVNVDVPQTPEISGLDVNVDVPQTTEIPVLDVNVDVPQTPESSGLDVNVDIPQTPEVSGLDVNVDVPQTTEIPGLDVDTTQNTETFEANPLPDVWEETPQATETPNIIGNIMSAGSGVAAGMGLWGLVNNSSQNDEQTNPEDTQESNTNPNLETPEVSGLDVNVDVPQTPEISGLDVNVDVPQTPEVSGLDVNVDVPKTTEIPGLDVNVDVPQTQEISGLDVNVDVPQTQEISGGLDVNVDVPQTQEISGLDVNADLPQTTEIPGLDVNVDVPQTPEVSGLDVNVDIPQNTGTFESNPLPDVWEETSETPQETETPNILGNVMSAGSGVAAGVAAAGMGLWGLVNNSSQNDEQTNPEDTQELSTNPNLETTEISGLDVNVDVPQTPEISGLDVNVDVPQTQEISGLDVNVEVPQIPEIPGLDVNVDIPQTPEISGLDVNVDVPQTIENLTETPEVSQTLEQPLGDGEESPENGLIDNLPLTGAAVLAGGAVIAAGIAGNNSDSVDENYQSEEKPEDNPDLTVAEVTEFTEVENEDLEVETSEIQIIPRTPKWAHITWQIAEAEREILRQQGASQLALRLYDVTDMDLSYQTPQLVQQYECEDSVQNRFVAIPISDRDYMVEIGYLTEDDRWLLLARSPIVRVFNRPQQEFWFETDVELIIHGSTQPGSTVSIAGNPIKVKSDGTFHLRIPFTQNVIDYIITSVSADGEQSKDIRKFFTQGQGE
ncbi:substrate-binding domain-containing protein [Calothrix sp. NIES-3974]|uniref:substrate-binding domain-containing protein n=1 Tax=Calothrix sp. NIES-3974 TaxID=2005462 RepID=UPI000B5EEA6B|nr:substrate-binding domain-containing protein [Calothrix sp. NIES-3974]BAZ03491.1 putative phosphate transport system substrate-binding protein [Calothrix sp. NIES-3974]